MPLCRNSMKSNIDMRTKRNERTNELVLLLANENETNNGIYFGNISLLPPMFLPPLTGGMATITKRVGSRSSLPDGHVRLPRVEAQLREVACSASLTLCQTLLFRRKTFSETGKEKNAKSFNTKSVNSKIARCKWRMRSSAAEVQSQPFRIQFLVQPSRDFFPRR